MRLHRFYVNKPLGEEIVVENSSEKEFDKKLLHQWTHVFRYISGDEVILFSSTQRGTDFLYRISLISKQSITLVPVSTSSNIVPTCSVTLVMALVKKDTFETIVRQATELGVTKIIPVLAARSEKKNLNMERLISIAIEASEQSGRGTVPEIAQILSFEEALLATSGETNIVASLHGKRDIHKDILKKAVAVWIGPEGGWTLEEEHAMQEKDFTSLLLTPTVLKADTGAIVALSTVFLS